MAYHEAATLTGSVKVIAMLALTDTLVAPWAGVGVDTSGGKSVGQGLSGVSLVLGSGAPATKSAELLSVSWHPAAWRNPAVVLDSVGAGPAPSKKFAPP